MFVHILPDLTAHASVHPKEQECCLLWQRYLGLCVTYTKLPRNQ